MYNLGFERLNDLNKFSFAKQIKEENKIIDMDINLENLKEAYSRLDGKFQEQNAGLLDSVCMFLDNMKHGIDIQENKQLLEFFLYVDFNKNNNANNCE
jgi:predicted component of type VI protein secretion system